MSCHLVMKVDVLTCHDNRGTSIFFKMDDVGEVSSVGELDQWLTSLKLVAHFSQTGGPLLPHWPL